MQIPAVVSRLRRACLALAGVALLSSPLAAQGVNTGAVEGRIQNGAKGEYLTGVLVTIDGTGLETRTDESGTYRFTNLPAGTVKVKAVYTGFPAQTESVFITPGQFAERDFDLSKAPAIDPNAPVRLDAVVISTSKEMDAAAFALNEKRAAANIMNVVAANEFGDNPDGNIGEFLKFLPGVQVDFNGGEPRTISLAGVGSNFVPITTGGFGIASAASGNTGRTVELEQISMNNISRVEVNFSQTPESPGGAIGGSVNLVPRSSFERSRPAFNSNVFYQFRDNDRHFRKSAGPQSKKTPKANPGGDFSWVVPVNKSFGFTLSGAHSLQYSPQDVAVLTWQGVGTSTNGTTFPHTTPDKPYLTSYSMRDAPKNTERDSLGLTLDFKLGRYDSISVGYQWSYFLAEFNDRSISFNVGSVSAGNFDSFHTYGNVGAGNITIGGSQREKAGTTWTPTIRWRHNGPIWKMDAGVSHSHGSIHYRDIDKGYFNNLNLRRTGVTVRFDDNWYLRPGKVTILDGTTGAVVDPSRLDSYYMNNGVSSSREGSDTKQEFQASIGRSFMLFGEKRIPLTAKFGTQVTHQRRDTRDTGNITYTWVGPDRVAHNGNPNTATSTDDGAAQIRDPDQFRTLPFGFWQQQMPSHTTAFQLYKDHPEYYTTDAGGNTPYVNRVNASKVSDEIISALYLRLDTAFFRNRLKFTGGYRAEQTNIEGEGPSNDPTANFQRDSSGKVLRDPVTNAILLKVPTSNALGVSQLTRKDRGTHAKKEYIRFFPSINSTYEIIPNLIIKGGLSTSVGRPDFNQYSGGVTLPDTETNPPPGNPSVGAARITVNNVGLKPQRTNSMNVALDYYFPKGVGNVSISGFRRDIRDFNSTIQYYPDPDFFALYGIDEGIYGGYPVSTQVNNKNKVRTEGWTFSYKQALTFFPEWARGVQVFANMSSQRQTGEQAGSFSNNRPRQYGWGFNLSRPKFNYQMNWAYTGERKRGLSTGNSIAPHTYARDSKKLYIDITTEYRLTKNWKVYATIRNLNDASEDQQRWAEDVTPDHARFFQRNQYGGVWTMGVRANF